jgi:hypothetical protein
MLGCVLVEAQQGGLALDRGERDQGLRRLDLIAPPDLPSLYNSSGDWR